jgi:ABC-type transport system involved in cytochrome bd biosynthesis fused ATPase/permease subunit
VGGLGLGLVLALVLVLVLGLVLVLVLSLPWRAMPAGRQCAQRCTRAAGADRSTMVAHVGGDAWVGVRRAAVAAEHAKALQTHERQHVTAAQKQADLETRVAAVRLRQL